MKEKYSGTKVAGSASNRLKQYLELVVSRVFLHSIITEIYEFLQLTRTKVTALNKYVVLYVCTQFNISHTMIFHHRHTFLIKTNKYNVLP